MLFHTFSNYGEDVNSNYMFFYNIFTGKVKIFYYYENQIPSSSSSWYIDGEGAKTCKFMDQPSNFFSLPDNEQGTQEKYLFFSNNTGSPIQALQPGWNGFEYWVPRYSTDYNEAFFTIGATESYLTSFNFTGISESKTNGTVTSVSSTDSSILDGVSNASGEGVKCILDSVANKFLKKPEVLGISISDIITSVSSGSYASIIKGGLKFLFGRSATSTYYTKADVALTTNGTIQLTGEATTPTSAVVNPLSFNLYDILNYDMYESRDSMRVPPWIIPINQTAEIQANGINGFKIPKRLLNLGVWTLKTAPKIYFNRVAPFTCDRVDYYPNGEVEFTGSAPFPTIQRYEIDLEINPAVEQYITSKQVTVNFFGYGSCNQANGQRIVQNFEHTPFYSNGVYSLYNLTQGVRNFFHISDADSDDFNFDDSTTFYYDWGPVIETGNTIAMVTLTMNINYQGESFTVEETRAYKVEYLMEESLSNVNSYHRPPQTYVINRGIPFWPERN